VRAPRFSDSLKGTRLANKCGYKDTINSKTVLLPIFRIFSCLLLTFILLFFIADSSAQTPTNSLRLERSGTGWRLRFALSETNGAFWIVRSEQVQNLVNAGQVLAIVGVAGSARSGAIEVPMPTSSQTFFGLVGDQNTLFPPPPGMVKIPAGTFVMGSPLTETGRRIDETQHTVTLTRDFYMSKYELTQGEYQAVMGSNPSTFTGDLNRPVENVSWNDATSYCRKMTASERAAGRLPAGWEYRLPTEAEWEYACRAGTSTAFHYGPELRSGMANFQGHYEYPPGPGELNGYHYNTNGTFLGRTTAVGSYQPNAFGLHDMHGNVWEWCLDWWDAYLGGSAIDPRGPASGYTRVIRNGRWNNLATICRSAYRSSYTPDLRIFNFGFRTVLAPVP
jgi:formylglycine-generating enzyme required for sulfatase activity